MPFHQGWLPREGLTLDPILRAVGHTALNPALLLPAILLARYTKKGQDWTILHSTAYARLKKLLYLALAKWLSAKYSEGVVNNWTRDTYIWPNEIAVVTGGAGGIGGHLVRLLAERGLTVVVLDIQELTYEPGPNVKYYRCDLTSASDVWKVASRVRSQVGDPTILVNNAGVARGKSILATTERDLKLTFDVNCFAHFYTLQAFLPAMVRANHGMVVTVASFAAWLTVPDMVDYGCSKAAAASLHEGLAAELPTRYAAPAVRTVVVNQGYTRTALFAGYHNEAPFAAPALEPESVAEAVARQILSGRSGQVVTPLIGYAAQWTRGLPHWFAYALRARSENIMTNFSGRQVIADPERHYAEREGEGEREKAAAAVEGSTVIVEGRE